MPAKILILNGLAHESNWSERPLKKGGFDAVRFSRITAFGPDPRLTLPHAPENRSGLLLLSAPE